LLERIDVADSKVIGYTLVPTASGLSLAVSAAFDYETDGSGAAVRWASGKERF
jgi:hypothetical protein